MPAAKSPATTRVLVPAAAESSTASRSRRVRLVKALAATPTAKIPGMTTPAKQRKSNEAKAQNLKPGSNRYKLPDEEYAQLTALKQRLETLGTRVKKSELLRAGLVLLVAMNDAQLKKAVSRAGLIEVGRRSRQASREAAA